jgi:adenosylcobyric acid synthase
LGAVLESFRRLASESDLVLVEGAGSASEINLRAGDIANFGFARAARVPVVLIGDIERGGVIASLVGTKAVIDADDAALIEGFIVNRFRGDPTLFDAGLAEISRRTGWRALGVVPFFDAARRLPAEDALGLGAGMQDRATGTARTQRIAVLAYPRIANFDDFDPLRQEPGVELLFVRSGETIPGDAALVVLPGSKATIADLAALRQNGWDIDLAAHRRRGGHILGICAGYQMLGSRIADPQGIEGPPAIVDALGLLDIETVLQGDKVLVETSGTTTCGDVPFKGYEMHIGKTTGSPAPLLTLADGRPDGGVSPDGRIAGCYIHGLFSEDRQRRHWLQRIGASTSMLDYEAGIDTTLDELAEHLERHVDCDALLALAREPSS